MCGEKSGFCQRSILHLGSPPRMRGKAIVIQRVDRLGGITPACAGKRTPLLTPRSVTWDHPRVCGEKRQLRRCPFRFRGSPPRMRGKVLCHRVRAGRIGITPAYAGKSARGIFRFGPVRDHPRVCGEKIFCHSVVLRLLGSPPRMRGKVTLEVTYATKPGITPAYAGKSIRATAILRQSRDHPRVCGEKKGLHGRGAGPHGSPPRMRGKAYH